MKVGTADILDVEEAKPKRPRGSVIGGGSGSSGGGNNGGPGGSRGDDHDDTDNSEIDLSEIDPTMPTPAKSRLLTYFLMLVVTMTFGGVIAAYIVIATNKALEWHPFDLPIQIWISTALIAMSSLVYVFAERAVNAEKHETAKKWLLGTTILGTAFISSQILVWMELSARGVYAYGNPYAGFFYILTALHAVHVMGGIIALGSLLLRSWPPPRRAFEIQRRKTLSQVVGWYWHMMGVLWLVLIGLLGFWQ